MPPEKKPRAGGSLGRMIGEYSQIAFTLPAAVFVGIGIGYALDRHWHTGHILAILGVFIGFAAGFAEVIRLANRK